MKNKDEIVKSAITSLLALATAGTLINTTHAVAAPQGTEKCYGIVKAEMNDCETTNTSCAGSAKQDAQSDAYILLPKGTCHKIVGASLKSVPPKKN